MPITDALLAYAHFMSIFALAAVLVAELIIFRQSMPVPIFRRLGAVDRWYGISAVLVIATGLARLNWGSQGKAWIQSNPVFWIKMALFVTVGLLSILPTVLYIRWRSRPAVDGSIVLEASEYSKVRLFLWLQVGVFVFIPLCATLMTRGI